MTRSPRLVQVFRLLHLYTGVFITPAVLFFALTGALQTFGLHETNRDHPDYKPARWIVVLGQLHKKQTAVVPVRRPPPSVRPAVDNGSPAANRVRSAATGAKAAVLGASPSPDPSTHRHSLPLRVFFLVVALGLFSSTLTGLTLTYKYVRNKPLITGLLAAGVVLPLALIFV